MKGARQLLRVLRPLYPVEHAHVGSRDERSDAETGDDHPQDPVAIREVGEMDIQFAEDLVVESPEHLRPANG